MTNLHRRLLSLLLLFTALASALPRTSSEAPSETHPLPAATPPPSLAAQTASSTTTHSPPSAVPTALGGVKAAAQPEFRPEDGPPDYDALIPADPDAEPRKTANLADYGLTQVTYYSCATFAATTQCGWHRPLVPVDSSSPPRAANGLAALVVAVSGFWCGFAALMLLS